MVNKDYQDELREEILGWYAPCKIRFYPNSVTVTLRHSCTSTDHLRVSVEDFLSQFEHDDIKVELIVKSPLRFSLRDLGEVTPLPIGANNEEFQELFGDWLEALEDDEDFNDEDEIDDEDDLDEDDADDSELGNSAEIYAGYNQPVNSREELLDMLRQLEDNKKPVPSLEERLLALQVEAIEAELVSFLKINVDHAMEILPVNRTLEDFKLSQDSQREAVELALKFGFLAGKWSQAAMKDLEAVMNVWGKHFGEVSSTIGL